MVIPQWEHIHLHLAGLIPNVHIYPFSTVYRLSLQEQLISLSIRDLVELQQAVSSASLKDKDILIIKL